MESPFNFKSAKLASVRGRVNKTFPPIANNTAKTANIRNNKILSPLDIFLMQLQLNILVKNINLLKLILYKL